jgi:hypothetical protein
MKTLEPIDLPVVHGYFTELRLTAHQDNLKVLIDLSSSCLINASLQLVHFLDASNYCIDSNNDR